MNAASLRLRRAPLLVFVVFYTLLTGGPFLWVASMSLRTTAEILESPYAVPARLHWEKFSDAWVNSNYGTYFYNSAIIVVSAVVTLTIIGAMAAHGLARYHFSGARAVRFAILSGMVLPPQLPRGSVRFSSSVRNTTANKNSFHRMMKLSVMVVKSAGRPIGKVMRQKISMSP
jgi:ABC-type glycerol-3-phosphate transport system permease component